MTSPFTLDEGEGIVDKRLGHAVMPSVNPFDGNLFLRVRYISEVEQLRLANMYSRSPSLGTGCTLHILN